MRRWFLCLAACTLSCAAFCADIVGKVTRVADGDTVTVLDAANVQHKIRLHGIDAPEKKQAFGEKSKQHLSSLVFGKDVRVKYKSRDKYGRIIGTVFVDGRDVNHEMLRAGLAWHYKRYDKSPEYASAELEAWQNHRGLWVDSNPTPPEQFRHRATSVAMPIVSVGAAPRADLADPVSRVEYRAGNAMPVSSHTAAPVCGKWPIPASGSRPIPTNDKTASARTVARHGAAQPE